MTIGGILDLRLFGCGGTPISSVSDSLSDRTANWFEDAKDELTPVGYLKWAPFAFRPRCRAKILRVNTG
jgi:hypothetical protein